MDDDEEPSRSCATSLEGEHNRCRIIGCDYRRIARFGRRTSSCRPVVGFSSARISTSITLVRSSTGCFRHLRPIPLCAHNFPFQSTRSVHERIAFLLLHFTGLIGGTATRSGPDARWSCPICSRAKTRHGRQFVRYEWGIVLGSSGHARASTCRAVQSDGGSSFRRPSFATFDHACVPIRRRCDMRTA
jgi:hypothetical protein